MTTPDPRTRTTRSLNPSAIQQIPSQQELDLLFCPFVYDEFFNEWYFSSDNIEPSTPTNAHAEEKQFDQAEFNQCLSVYTGTRNCYAEIFPHARDMVIQMFITFNQPKNSDYHQMNKRKSPINLKFVEIPSKQCKHNDNITTDPDMSCSHITVSNVETKNIKNVMQAKVDMETKKDEGQNVIRTKHYLLAKGYAHGRGEVYVAQPDVFVIPDQPYKVLPSKGKLPIWIKTTGEPGTSRSTNPTSIQYSYHSRRFCPDTSQKHFWKIQFLRDDKLVSVDVKETGFNLQCHQHS
ncbi:hypothetical protein Tco_0671968 [Tanacetum coccineum]